MIDHDMGGYSDMVKQLRNHSRRLVFVIGFTTAGFLVPALSIVNAAKTLEFLGLGDTHPLVLL